MRSAPLKLPSYKRKIITALFFAAIILILLNLALDKIFLSDVKNEKELSSTEVEAKFKTAVYNFGLEKGWVKKIRTETDDLYYKVDLPPDLPVTLILREINLLFKEDDVHLESEEEKINGRTNSKIFSGSEVKLKAQFRYNPNLKRNAGEITFFLTEILILNEKEDSLLLCSPEQFYLLLIPSSPASAEARKISRYGKKYGLVLNDDIPDLKYNFKEGYSNGRLRASVREIIADFPDINFLIADDNSALYSASFFPFVENEFTRRNFNLLKKSSLEFLGGRGTEEIISKFRKIAAAAESSKILTSVQNYLLLIPEIMKFKKIGCKFVLH